MQTDTNTFQEQNYTSHPQHLSYVPPQYIPYMQTYPNVIPPSGYVYIADPLDSQISYPYLASPSPYVVSHSTPLHSSQNSPTFNSPPPQFVPISPYVSSEEIPDHESKITSPNPHFSGKILENVWYRYDGKKGFGLRIYKDSGKLVVNLDGIQFIGTKHHVYIPKETVTGIELGLQGKDMLNIWIRIEYEEDGMNKAAHFMDGRWFGWREAFGGNNRILKEIGQVFHLTRKF